MSWDTLTKMLKICFFILVIVPSSQSSTAKIVQTSLGAIRGTYENVPGKTKGVFQYRKIPYAKPPIEDLRLQKPVPVDPWTGELDGEKFGPSCIQNINPALFFVLPNVLTSEDCLHLNLYVPANNTSDKEGGESELKPVMVWIHPGAYINGQATLFDGSYLAVTGDVIVVTINYRLGMLGFFSYGEFKGNYGLWDQIEALKWVQNNIESFGGDPKRVTVFGCSAGGFSAGLLSLIPDSRGLFQRIIMQSGTFNSHFAMARDDQAPVNKFVQFLNCNNHLNYFPAFAHCIRMLPSKEIVNVQNMYSGDDLLFDNLFGPTVDGELIETDPVVAVQDSSSAQYQFYRSLDIMSGCVNTEGSLFLYALPYLAKEMNFDYKEGVPTKVLREEIAPIISKNVYNNSANAVHSITFWYSSNDPEEQARKLVDLYGDIFFYRPMEISLDIHSAKNNKTKAYEYLFTEPTSYADAVGPKKPQWFKGAAHVSEMPFLFGLQKLPRFGVKVNQAHLKLSETMMKFWTNFARSGDPNTGNPVGIVWPQYNPETKKYLNLASNPKVENHILRDRMEFWKHDLTMCINFTTINDLSAGLRLHSLLTYSYLCLILWFVHTIFSRL